MDKTKSSFKGICRGVKLNTSSGTYYVEKYIRGERYYTTTQSESSARDWYKNFHPSLSLGEVDNSKLKRSAKKRLQEMAESKLKKTIRKINGNDLGYNFFDVWELYKAHHLSTVEKSTRYRRLNDCRFYILLKI